MQHTNGILSLSFRELIKASVLVLASVTLFACSAGDDNNKAPTNHDNPTINLPLVPPITINSQSDTSKIIIDWPVDDNVESYELFWSVNTGTGAAGSAVIIPAGKQSFTHEFLADGVTKINSGTTYYYTIIAVKGTEKSPLSIEVSAKLKTSPVPAMPQGLLITPQKTSITLSWTNDPAVTNYFVYWSNTRSTGIAGNKQAITAGQTRFKHEFIDTNATPLKAATDYYYVVTAQNANGLSLSSAEVSARLLAIIVVEPTAGPTPPTAITLTPQNSQIQLQWPNDPKVLNYNVYWSTTSGLGTTGTKVALAAGVTNFAHEFLSDNKTRLSNGVDFYYVVTAVDANKESVASAEMTGRLKNKAWIMPLFQTIMDF